MPWSDFRVDWGAIRKVTQPEELNQFGVKLSQFIIPDIGNI